MPKFPFPIIEFFRRKNETPHKEGREGDVCYLPSPREKLLLEAGVREKTRLHLGQTNEVWYIELENGLRGIFKPFSGERPQLRGEKVGEYYKREVAAYRVARLLGFDDLVPPTVIREIDGARGSLEEFVPLTVSLYSRFSQIGLALAGFVSPEKELGPFSNQFVRLLIFDYIIWNLDRSGSNILCTQEALYGIDHGLSFEEACWGDQCFPFTTYHPLSPFLFQLPVPVETIEKLRKFCDNEDQQKLFVAALSDLLSPREIEACLHRIKKITQIILECEEGKIPKEREEELLEFDPFINDKE